MFYKKSVVKNCTKITGKYLRRNIFFTKFAGFRLEALLKRESDKITSLWIVQNFQKHLFYRTTSGDCFCLMEYEKFASVLY